MLDSSLQAIPEKDEEPEMMNEGHEFDLDKDLKIHQKVTQSYKYEETVV